ncbi:hypothetical protein DFH11DRAFT_1576683, partial [Phellopilus nigrolimitatus]
MPSANPSGVTLQARSDVRAVHWRGILSFLPHVSELFDRLVRILWSYFHASRTDCAYARKVYGIAQWFEGWQQSETGYRRARSGLSQSIQNKHTPDAIPYPNSSSRRSAPQREEHELSLSPHPLPCLPLPLHQPSARNLSRPRPCSVAIWRMPALLRSSSRSM